MCVHISCYVLGVCTNSDLSFLINQVSRKRNKLLKQQVKHSRQQLQYTRLEVNLNVKGKKLALLAQASELLKKDRLALREFRNELHYDSDGSEAKEMKESILYYKKSVVDAKRAIDEVAATPPAAVVDPHSAAVSSPAAPSITAPVDSPSSMVESTADSASKASAASSVGSASIASIDEIH
jgi:uncharacterized phage infection (PIP) family protein YhgE